MRPESPSRLPTCVLLLVLGAALVPGWALAQAPRGLVITATPRWLQLGVDTQAQLRVETAPEVTELRLFTSRGEVDAPVEEAPGRYRATYRVPRQGYPQVAILTAVARGPQGVLHGWAVLQLWGQGTVEVLTRPGAPVSLRLGAQQFGPVTADERGVARVPVRVPPGVESATFGRRTIELGVPPLPHVQALPERLVVPGDSAQEVTVRLYAVTPEGRPRRGSRFQLEATRGSAQGPEALAPGVSVVHWRLPPGPPGEVELRGQMPGDSHSSFQVKVRVVPGPARRFSLELDRAWVCATESRRVEVVAVARDDAGNPAEAALRVDSELGGGGALRPLGEGRYTGTLELPAHFGERESVRVGLYAEGDGAPLLERALALRPGAPARVEVTPLEERLVSDGRREVGWRVRVEDAFGNPVREPPHLVEASGAVAVPRPLGPGAWEVRYVPPVVYEEQAARLEVRAGDARGEGQLVLRPHSLWATASLRAGVVTDFGRLLAPSSGAQVELRSGLSRVGLLLAADALSFGGPGGGEALAGFEGRHMYLSLSTALTVRGWPGARLEVWGGAGPSLAWVRGRTRLAPGPPLEESTAVWGAQVLLGAGRRLGPGLPFLELRGLWFADPSLHVLRGQLLGAGLQAGYRLEFL